MTHNFYSIVTNIGLVKQLECLEKATSFDISEIAVGDGNGELYEPQENQIELKHELWRGSILTHGVDDNKLFVTTSIPIDVGDFTIREIGLFDSNNNLLCIAKCPETNKHNSNNGGAQELLIKIYMNLTNSDIAPLITQESTVMASVDFVNQTFATQNLDNLTTLGQAKFDAKQDILIAGLGIDILNNVISTKKELPQQTSNNGKFLKTDGASVSWEDIPTSHALFDIVQKDHILNYEESKGLAQLGSYVYKEAVAGVRYGYPDFYLKCLAEYQEGAESFIASNINKIGGLIDKEGVVNNFNASNYVKLPNTFTPGTSNWEILLKVNTGTNFPNINAPLFRDGSREHDGFVLYGRTGGILNVFISSDGTNWDIAQNISSTLTVLPSKEYYIKSKFNGDEYTGDVSEDNENWTNYITVTSSLTVYNSLNQSCLGWEQYGYYWTGSFDLNECYIKIDDEIWWQGAISGNKLSNGHFYYNIEDKDVVDEIYTNQGTAWYYGVDIDNERIFLPRNDWFF